MAEAGEPGEGPSEPGQAAQAGQRPADAGQHEGGQGPAARHADDAERRAGEHAQHGDPLGVAHHDGDREQPADPGAGEGERVPPVLAREQHDTTGGGEDEEEPEPEVVEREHRAGEDAGGDGAEEHRDVRGSLALGPEAAEEVVEQRARRDGHGRPGCLGAGAGAADGTGGTRTSGVRAADAAGRSGGVSGSSTWTRPPVPPSGSTKRMEPPCRSVTQRAMASPRPVPPPPSVAVRVPKRLEDALPVGGRDPGALVVHLEDEAVAAAYGGHEHRAARGTVPRGVVEEVGHELAQPRGVGADHEVGRLDTDLVDHGAPQQACLGDGVLEQRQHRDGGRVEGRLAGVDPREVEQVLDETAGPLGLVEGGPEGGGVVGPDAVDDVLEHRAEPGQRGAQLVADVGDELTTLAVDGVEVARHRVEGAGELADLVARGVGRPGRRSHRWPSGVPPRSSAATVRSSRRRAAG